MRPYRHHPRSSKLILLVAASLGLGLRLVAITPEEWRHTQMLDVESTGLVRVELPPATLDAARPSLEDLRLLDAAGNEVPYMIERPLPKAGSTLRPGDFHAGMAGDVTTINVQTGTTLPLTGVTLATPASSFMKAVRVEGSHDAKDWTELASGQAVFRFPGGAEKLDIPFATGVWEFLRMTVADDRSQPVPFTGAELHAAGVAAPSGSVSVSIKSRDEGPGVTRLSLDLGAANLPVAFLEIETPEPLFTRNITLAVPEVTDEGMREQSVGHGTIYRVNIDGKNTERLDIPVETTIHSRELILSIRNEDNPPLAIGAVHASQRLTRLIFFTGGAGRYTLLSGNSQCTAPRYDLPALKGELNTASDAKLSPLAGTPGYKQPEALAALPLGGAGIDLAGWKFHKPVQLTGGGVQQLELDTEILAHTAPDQRDLRLVCEGKQLPFLFERPSISRDIALNETPVIDPKNPARSLWSLKLPRTGIPITRLACVPASPLFQRDVRVWEEMTDERGEKYPYELGRATWRQTPGHASREFVIEFDRPPSGDTFFLEIDNGDNPAIELHGFRCFYPVTRIVFKALPDASKPVWLYYGNPDAVMPHYDLSLVAAELPGADKTTAIAGTEEPLKPAGTTNVSEPSSIPGGIVFWGVLGLVVVALLVVVSRLLPKQTGRQ